MVEAARLDADGTRIGGCPHRADVRAGHLAATRARRYQLNGAEDGGAIEILIMLAWTIYISFLGVVVLMLLPKTAVREARAVALASALGGFFIALFGFAEFKAGEIVTVAEVDWIPSLGINYHLAADGISLTLVFLTGLAAVAGILFSWSIGHRTKEFFAFYLALIGGVYGVFLSFDVFLLFVFYEIAIIPKYFIIAIWGSTRKEYGATGILFSWNIGHRTKEFFAFYPALIGGVYGVFLSFDVFLLFVFYEIAIIPKYFIIAIS